MSAYSRNNLQTAYARFWFQNVDHAARRRLWLKLAKLIGNGVQILQAVESIRDRRIASGGKDDPETYALDAWSAAMKNGSRLSRAMDGWVTVEEMMLISAGEQSGTLESALRSAARVMEARKRISSAVYAGLAYPFVLMLMATSWARAPSGISMATPSPMPTLPPAGPMLPLPGLPLVVTPHAMSPEKRPAAPHCRNF